MVETLLTMMILMTLQDHVMATLMLDKWSGDNNDEEEFSRRDDLWRGAC